MTKVDLHLHTGDDPEDGLSYTAVELIDKAVALGFRALAITLHEAVLEDERVFEYAHGKGLLLIRGVEWESPRGDVLLYNVSQREHEQLRTFEDLRALRHKRGDEVLTIAPHPFFFKHSLHSHLERNIELFDAIEYCHLHFPWLNLNRQAERVAARHGKTLVATSDTHNLWMFGQHYTLVDAEPTISSLFAAIRAGRVERHSPPETLGNSWRMFVSDPFLHRKPGRIIRSFD